MLLIHKDAAKESLGVTQCKFRQASACERLSGTSSMSPQEARGKVSADNHHMPQQENPSACGEGGTPLREAGLWVGEELPSGGMGLV